jgi:sulfite exporter TauE/SafE
VGVLSSLLATAFVMGLAGIPHCTAMCGAACAAAFPRGLSPWALLGRAIGYAALGGVAAAAAGLISTWGQQVAMLKPLWMMAQLAMVLLGGFMLSRGFIPQQVDQAGKGLYLRLRARWQATPDHARPTSSWFAPLVAGLVWALLPCGLLYAALMVAALASRPWEGALVMLAFAVPSAIGVWAAPAMLRWLRQNEPVAAAGGGASVPVVWMRRAGAESAPSSDDTVGLAAPRRAMALPNGADAGRAPGWVDQRLAVRVAGLGLASMAAWGLWHQLWTQWQAWCA